MDQGQARSVSAPQHVQVGPHLYTIKWGSKAVRKRGRVGEHEAETLTISIGDRVEGSQRADTLLHEILHAILSQTALDHELDHDAAESLVLRLTPLLLSVIHDNPDLVRYLQVV